LTIAWSFTPFRLTTNPAADSAFEMPRLIFFLVYFFTVTPTFIATLWVLEKLNLPGHRPISLRYYRALCAVLRVRIHIVGTPMREKPTLIHSNHVSWLDIPVISAITPIAFVAKKEVASWPVVGIAAKLLRTVFVDRTRRLQTHEVNAEIAQRLTEGDPVVLFAEGTSSDGNRVLEFRSALIGAVTHLGTNQQVMLQPISVGYTRTQGIPLGRQHRPLVAWYGDIDFVPHFKNFLARSAVDVVVTFGQPVPFDNGLDRKTVARTIEQRVRQLTAETLRERTSETVT
jgi:lyso-ornithine lipid O-acyltransferase